MPPRSCPSQADAYRKCLRAVLMAGAKHDCPMSHAILAEAYQTVCAFLVAQDPEAIEAVMSEPLRALPRTASDKINCGTRFRVPRP
jgi:hypothetical protein